MAASLARPLLLALLLAAAASAVSLPQALPGCVNYAMSRTGTDDSSILTQAYVPSLAYAPDVQRYLVLFHADDIPAAFEVYAEMADINGVRITNRVSISHAGDDPSDTEYDAFFGRAAYSVTSKRFLTVYLADQQGFSNAFEIYGQLVDQSAVLIGPAAFRISKIGASDTDAGAQAGIADVAWNSDDNEFLVVYTGNDHRQNKVYVQVVTAEGALKGSAIRVSYQGPNDIANAPIFYDVLKPRVAYGKGQYMVSFAGDYAAGGGHVWEAYVSILDRNANLQTNPSVRVSHMGAVDTEGGSRAFDPVLVFNPDRNEYLVAWYGDDADEGATGALDIYGQIVTATGAPTGPPQFQISRAGDNSRDPTYDAVNPKLSYDAVAQQYYVVYGGDSQDFDNANEVWAQRVSPAGFILDPKPVRVSYAGGENRDRLLVAAMPEVAASSPGKLFVVFQYTEFPPEDTTGGQDGALEIWAANLDSTLKPITGEYCGMRATKKRNTGIIIGAVIGAVIGAAVLIAIGVYIALRVKGSKQEKSRSAAAAARKAGAAPAAATTADGAGKAGKAGQAGKAGKGTAAKKGAKTPPPMPDVSDEDEPASADSAEPPAALARRRPTPAKSATASPKAGAAAAASLASPKQSKQQQPQQRSKKRVSKKRPSRKAVAGKGDRAPLQAPEYSYTFSYEYYSDDVAAAAPPPSRGGRAQSQQPQASPLARRAPAPAKAGSPQRQQQQQQQPARRYAEPEDDDFSRSYDQ